MDEPSAERQKAIVGARSASSNCATRAPFGSIPTRERLRSGANVQNHATCAAGVVRVTGWGIGWGSATALALGDGPSARGPSTAHEARKSTRKTAAKTIRRITTDTTMR